MLICSSEHAWQDYIYWQKQDNPSWNTKKTKPLAHAGYKVPGYVLGVPQI